MSDNINMDGQVVPVIVQSYLDWERPAAINSEQKKMKKQNSASSKETLTAVTKNARVVYFKKRTKSSKPDKFNAGI
jgi:hypothetical protein